MFDSGVFDVVIGMVLFYLLLSLIASGVNEVIASFFRWRARDLEQAIQNLLEKQDLLAAFYNHGLVQTLTSRYTLWERFLKFIRGSKGPQYHRPSYIPRQIFVRVLLEAIQSYVGSRPADKLSADARAIQARVVSLLSSVDTVAPPTGEGEGEGEGGEGGDSTPTPAAEANRVAFENLRTAIQSARPFLPDNLYQSLRSLVSDRSVTSVAEAIQKIEDWFDEVMQRASSLYKSKVQHSLLLIGLVISLALNADSLMMGNVLWHSGPMRESVVAAAEAIVRDNTLNPPAPPENGDAGTVAPTPVLSGTYGTSGLILIRQVISETKALGLPLGWNQNPGLMGKDPTAAPADISGWLLKLLGLLATTISISLGAPFWFDLLSKFMNVRSAVKPKSDSEHSPQSNRS